MLVLKRIIFHCGWVFTGKINKNKSVYRTQKLWLILACIHLSLCIRKVMFFMASIYIKNEDSGVFHGRFSNCTNSPSDNPHWGKEEAEPTQSVHCFLLAACTCGFPKGISTYLLKSDNSFYETAHKRSTLKVFTRRQWSMRAEKKKVF